MIFSFKNSFQFKKEIEEWQKEGIIDASQAEKLFEKYELNAAPPWYRNTNYVISGVSLLLVAMSFFLLIASNWENLGTPLRMCMGLVPFMLSLGCTIFFTQKNNALASELAAFMTSLIFGANIALQAQIFHISSYYPDGVLWWILGTLPFIIYFRSALMSVVYQFLFIIWLFWQSDYHQFAPLGVGIFAVFGFVLYQKPNALSALFYGFTSFFFLLNILAFVDKHFGTHYLFSDGTFFLGIAFMLFYVEVLNKFESLFSESFLKNIRNAAHLIVIFTFFAYTAPTVIKNLSDQNDYLILPFIFLGLSFLAVGFQKNTNFMSWAVLGLLGVLLIEFSINLESTIAFFLNNSVMLAFFVWKIQLGIAQKDKQTFMWGVFGIIVLAIGRYLSLIEDYITSSIIFMLAGVGLFFINRYWNRKFGKNEA